MAVGTSLAPRKVMVVADPTHESAAALQYALSHGLTDQDELILLHVESPAGSWTSAFSTLFRRHSHHYHHHDRQRQHQHHHHRHIFHSQHRGRLRNHARDASYTSVGAGEGGSSTAVQRATGGLRGRETDFLEEMKSVCELAQPKVRVRIERAENKEGKDKASVIIHQSTMHGVDVLIVGQRRSLSTAILGRSSAAGGSTKEKDTAEYLIKHSKCDCVGVQRKGQNAGYLLNTKTCRNFWLLA